MLEELLNFAETWDRNWNFGGHTVDSRFTEDYGKWDYTESTYEPWLFDRVTVGYRLFELTGNARWRDKFLSDFAYYRAHIDGRVCCAEGRGRHEIRLCDAIRALRTADWRSAVSTDCEADL